MSKTIKATLFNALIFPGSGLVSLGAKRGWIYIAIAAIALIMFMLPVFKQINAIVSSEVVAQGVPNVDLVAKQVSENLGADGTHSLVLAILVIVGMWVISIVDGIITGTRIERIGSRTKTGS